MGPNPAACRGRLPPLCTSLSDTRHLDHSRRAEIPRGAKRAKHGGSPDPRIRTGGHSGPTSSLTGLLYSTTCSTRDSAVILPVRGPVLGG